MNITNIIITTMTITTMTITNMTITNMTSIVMHITNMTIIERTQHEEDSEHHFYMSSEYQNNTYAQFIKIQKEFQLDVAEPVTNVARTAGAAFTDSLDKRREKGIARNKKANTRPPWPSPTFLHPHNTCSGGTTSNSLMWLSCAKI